MLSPRLPTTKMGKQRPGVLSGTSVLGIGAFFFMHIIAS
jgi:hypothetical protein